MARKKVLILKVILLLVICENQAARLPDNTQYDGVPDVYNNQAILITYKQDGYRYNDQENKVGSIDEPENGGPGEGPGSPEDENGGPGEGPGSPEDQNGGPGEGPGSAEDENGGPGEGPGSPEDENGGPGEGPGSAEDENGGPGEGPGSPEDENGGPGEGPGSAEDENGGPGEGPGSAEDENGGPGEGPGSAEDENGGPGEGPGSPEDENGDPGEGPGSAEDENGGPGEEDSQEEDDGDTEYELAPSIEIDGLGSLTGIVIHDRLQSPIYAYLKIPYAKQPIGDLRFAAPELPEGLGDRNPREDMPFCMQYNRENEIIGLEDCLYLNVYVPASVHDSDEDKPVMVFFHGDNFDKGSGRLNEFDPRFLLTEDVILVTVNYRLGIFGFLNFQHDEGGISGNAGLKDQLMALQWIKTHISNFNGDHKNVCLFGQGAGAASVHLHILSPKSKDLFHKAILQSGTALSPWALGSKNNGIQLADRLGFTTTNQDLMLYNLRARTAPQILTAATNISNDMRIPESPWSPFAGPIVETPDDEETGFLIDDPINIIESGEYNDVPLIIGFTDSEGIGVEQVLKSKYLWNREIDLFNLIPTELPINRDTTASEEIKRRLIEFYVEDDEGPIDLVALFTDVFFGFPAFRTALAHAEKSEKDIFFYKFSADTELNIFRARDKPPAGTTGASHGDDLGYLFSTPLTPDTLDLASIAAMERVVKIWTTFATSGKPTIAEVPEEPESPEEPEEPESPEEPEEPEEPESPEGPEEPEEPEDPEEPESPEGPESPEEPEEPEEPESPEGPEEPEDNNEGLQHESRSVSLSDPETWLPFTTDYAHYASIQTDNTQISSDPNSDSMELWVSIYKDFIDGSAAVHAISVVLTLCIVAVHIIVNQY